MGGIPPLPVQHLHVDEDALGKNKRRHGRVEPRGIKLLPQGVEVAEVSWQEAVRLRQDPAFPCTKPRSS